MNIKNILTKLDDIANNTRMVAATPILNENKLSQYIGIIAEEHQTQEKIGFLGGKRRSLDHDLKKAKKDRHTFYRSGTRGIRHLMMDDNQPDSVSMDIPLLIRLLEYAREEAQSDVDIHQVTEKLIGLSTEGRTLSMDDYNGIVGPSEDDEQPVENI
jgi:hypothetical protein